MISYTASVAGLTPGQLRGFFVGWPNPPSPETHLKLLIGSEHIVLAVDSEIGKVVGFITAITDGVLSAYIPHLEVLSDYQGHGIGTELMRRMLEMLHGLYMIDLQCDPGLESFYVRFGMQPGVGMYIRNYERQSGAEQGQAGGREGLNPGREAT
jgi:ribosomal protein S18 acetylase RimI-like enzyme